MPGDAASARIKPEGVRLDPALRAAGEKRIVLLWNLGRSSRPQTVPDRTSQLTPPRVKVTVWPSSHCDEIRQTSPGWFFHHGGDHVRRGSGSDVYVAEPRVGAKSRAYVQCMRIVLVRSCPMCPWRDTERRDAPPAHPRGCALLLQTTHDARSTHRTPSHQLRQHHAPPTRSSPTPLPEKDRAHLHTHSQRPSTPSPDTRLRPDTPPTLTQHAYHTRATHLVGRWLLTHSILADRPVAAV